MAGAQGATQEQEELDDEHEEELDDEHEEDDDDEGEKFDKDRALSTIKRQRDSEKKLKKQLADLRSELKGLKDKDLPDADRIKKEMADAEERATKAERALRKATLRSEALEQASVLGFKNPALAYKMIDPDDVDWDEDEPNNVRDLLRDVLKDNPYLKGRRRRVDEDDEDEDDDDDVDAGRRKRKPSSAQDMNKAIRRAAGR